ncbi:MAG: ArnT family glycosyltransferase [Acidobacteriaceae bacterium]
MAWEPYPPRTPSARQCIRATALAALLAAIVILTLLGHNRLTDWDEGIYAEVSREMLQTGWLVPHWNSFVWIDKPPLTYWITALFFKLLGVSEFTARLGSALSAIAIVTLLHAWLMRTRDTVTAWLSTVILLSTFGFLHVARVGETDTLLSFGCLLALIGLSNLLGHASSSRGWSLYWIGFAVALMSKSAASGTLFFTLLALLLLEPTLRLRLRTHFRFDFLPGFFLFLALTLPWHLFMLHRFGRVFVMQYLGLHVLGRVAYPFDGHLTHWWYYFRVLLFSAPPWVLLYPFALYTALRKPSLRPMRVFAVFALVQIFVFSCVQTRLPHYVAPAYAPLSALVAIWLADRLATFHLNRFGVRVQLATVAAALWIVIALLTAHGRSQLHSPRLPNGDVTPDNREEVALLQQVFRHPALLVVSTPGPLLDWRTGNYNPIPTVIFYANRPVQQVQLHALPPGTPTDIYVFNPIALAQGVTTQPRLLLIDRSLLPRIPSGYSFHPIAISPTLELGLIARLP